MKQCDDLPALCKPITFETFLPNVLSDGPRRSPVSQEDRFYLEPVSFCCSTYAWCLPIVQDYLCISMLKSRHWQRWFESIHQTIIRRRHDTCVLTDGTLLSPFCTSWQKASADTCVWSTYTYFKSNEDGRLTSALYFFNAKYCCCQLRWLIVHSKPNPLRMSTRSWGRIFFSHNFLWFATQWHSSWFVS
jgi:hypothetical protein